MQKKNVILSIRKKWLDKIFSGEKTVEVRRTEPVSPVDRIFFYESGPDGAHRILGECRLLCTFWHEESAEWSDEEAAAACLSWGELWRLHGIHDLYGWRLQDVKKYPEDWDIRIEGIVPQSWRYISPGDPAVCSIDMALAADAVRKRLAHLGPAILS